MEKNVGLSWLESSMRLSPELSSGSTSLSYKADKKSGHNIKWSHSFKIGTGTSLKWGLDGDIKKTGTNIGGNLRASYNLPPYNLQWKGYEGHLTHAISGSGSVKSDGKYKLDSKYIAHLLTKDKHKLYF